MNKEKYLIDIGKEGSIGLTRLDYCFNPTTKCFLHNVGLKQGMNVLDVGCGAGVMSTWLAEQVGQNGKVIALENNEHQLNAAKKHAEKNNIQNIEFMLGSIYELKHFKETFDLIYCRFVIHHLNRPIDAIKQIYAALKPGGIYASEEGIVNFAFSYPFTKAWGDESARVPPVWIDAPIDQRDGNIGIKMFHKMRTVGFNIVHAQIIHPLLITHEEKSLLLLGRDEMKAFHLMQGGTQEEWEALGKDTEKLVVDDNQIAGFYASFQVGGVKN